MYTIKDVTVTQRKNGFEYRFRKNGQCKSFYGTTKEKAKEKAKAFINELNKTFNVGKRQTERLPTTTTQAFTPALEFFEKWFSQVKIHQVKPNTYKALKSKFKTNIAPHIKNIALENINAETIQQILNKATPRNKEDIKSIFNQCLNYAIGCNKIKNNPCAYIKITKHLRENGKALSKEEISTLKAKIKNNELEIPILIFLYSGIRACEWSTLEIIQINNNYCFKVKNGKIKSGNKETYRNIPILNPILPLISEIPQILKKNIKPFKLQRYYHEITGGHLKDLRHTFATHCRKFIDNEIVSLWQGHTLNNITATVYTHFDIEYQIEQAQKINY